MPNETLLYAMYSTAVLGLLAVLTVQSTLCCKQGLNAEAAGDQ